VAPGGSAESFFVQFESLVIFRCLVTAKSASRRGEDGSVGKVCWEGVSGYFRSGWVWWGPETFFFSLNRLCMFDFMSKQKVHPGEGGESIDRVCWESVSGCFRLGWV
jgi:hypothetical protein